MEECIEIVVGILFMIFGFIYLWKINDRITKIEAIVDLLEREIKAIHNKGDK